jgi:DNA-binding response OmpR family regulator
MVPVFGDPRLDRKRRELRRGGEPVAIEPRAFDLFAFLVRRRDRVVTKDDLLQGVCEEVRAVIARLRAVTPEVIPPWIFQHLRRAEHREPVVSGLRLALSEGS